MNLYTARTRPPLPFVHSQEILPHVVDAKTGLYLTLFCEAPSRCLSCPSSTNVHPLVSTPPVRQVRIFESSVARNVGISCHDPRWTPCRTKDRAMRDGWERAR